MSVTIQKLLSFWENANAAPFLALRRWSHQTFAAQEAEDSLDYYTIKLVIR